MAENQSPGLLNLESELTCSICTDVLYQPLTLLDCLHTFCGSCLKEWFSSQAATSSSPISPTCPQCRAQVRETRPNATVTTLLDMYLQVNPSQRKPQAEKDALAKIYEPGDNVLPKIKRRRVNRAEVEDRRLVEEIRELSFREVETGPRSRRTERETQSTSRETRATSSGHRRRGERGGSRDRQATERGNAHPSTSQTNVPTAASQSSHRELEHQSSLRSLLSGTDDNNIAEEILRQIREEGLLDGVNLDDLDTVQEDELSERIAEAYRRRHIQHSDDQYHRSDGTSARSSRTHEERSSRRHHERSRSGQGQTQSTEPPNGEGRHPPVSRPHLLPINDRHGRSTSSDHGRRQTSPGPRTSRSSNAQPQATRSTTDLSRPASRSPQTRPRQLSDTSRSTADPPVPRVTDTWSQIQRRDLIRQSEGSDANNPSLTSSPITDTFRQTSRPSPPTTPRQVESRPGTGDRPPERIPRPRITSLPTPTSEPSEGKPTSSSASSISAPRTRPSLYPEPSITCDRCEKRDIQYELHKNCSRCKDGNYNLCLPCFRAGKGCNHWFGFGHKALANYHDKHPTERGRDRPHVLSGHKYLPPREGSIQPSSPPTRNRLTSDDPSKRLQSGMFCDMCLSFADNCYWKCEQCNEGEWGFCNNCVNTGKCCTHPLLPLTHESTSDALPPGAAILDTPAIPDFGDYCPLTFSTKCNICNYPISPSTTRFHCPQCSSGDYNIHDACYLKLVAAGKVSKENGPSGWRRCPLNGHRMIVIGYEDHPEGQKRVIIRDLVGGYGIEDSKMSPTGVTPHWRWQGADGQRRTRLISRDVSASTTASITTSSEHPSKSFPPDGGEGMVAVARWSYFPESAGEKDLAFPKWAEVREVEEINEDWLSGVYAGRKGVFYAPFVMIVSGERAVI